MNTFHIATIKVPAFIGIEAWEKKVKQTLHIDLSYALNPLDDAPQTIEQTVDYAQVIARVQLIVAEEAIDLLEQIAQKIGRILCQEFAMHWIKVTVTKPFITSAATNVSYSFETTNNTV